MPGKIEGKRRRGQQSIKWIDSFTDSMSKLWEIVENRGAWSAIVYGVTKNRTQLSDWTTTTEIRVVFHMSRLKLQSFCHEWGASVAWFSNFSRETGISYLPGGSDDKESACNARDLCSIPGLGRSPGERHGNPHEYSCLENSMHRETWLATIHGVAKSWTWLSMHLAFILPLYTFHCLS